MEKENIRICVIGLGYVGLPLARLFSTRYETIGYDVNGKRCRELMSGHDATGEIDDETLLEAIREYGFRCTDDIEQVRGCNFYVVAVPTPVGEGNVPDLGMLLAASETVGKVIAKGDAVVFESTVYPGVTERRCAPVIGKVSGLVPGKDFHVGYSPERINPGDREHTVERIRKIVSGSSPEALDLIDGVYSSVIVAGTHRVSSIKVAEAAKVVENTQRDINIAFMNELARMFALDGVDTSEVLEAAATKWNFMPFRPGLVGGHCIGVDPYYLARYAEELGMYAEIVLAARRRNEGMASFVATEVAMRMAVDGIPVRGSRILVLGFAFKEDCPDIRNTKVVGMVAALKGFGARVEVVEPLADLSEIERQYGVTVFDKVPGIGYDAVIRAVSHKEFAGIDARLLVNGRGVIYDVRKMTFVKG